jgi:hypothetical protein
MCGLRSLRISRRGCFGNGGKSRCAVESRSVRLSVCQAPSRQVKAARARLMAAAALNPGEPLGPVALPGDQPRASPRHEHRQPPTAAPATPFLSPLADGDVPARLPLFSPPAAAANGAAMPRAAGSARAGEAGAVGRLGPSAIPIGSGDDAARGVHGDGRHTRPRAGGPAREHVESPPSTESGLASAANGTNGERWRTPPGVVAMPSAEFGYAQRAAALGSPVGSVGDLSSIRATPAPDAHKRQSEAQQHGPHLVPGAGPRAGSRGSAALVPSYRGIPPSLA